MMMSIDNEIQDEEMNLYNLFAIRLGYSRESSKELIDALCGNIMYGQSHDEAMKRFEWMLN